MDLGLTGKVAVITGGQRRNRQRNRIAVLRRGRKGRDLLRDAMMSYSRQRKNFAPQLMVMSLLSLLT